MFPLRVLPWLAGLGLCAVPLTLSADLVRLKSGGELRGELRDGSPSEETVTVQTLTGAEVTLAREEVDFIKRRSPLMEEYVTRSRLCAETVAARWELAEWCRQHQLDAGRTEQLERILDLEPDHADARRLLGYVYDQGRWILRDDLMALRGYVRHKGRWVSQTEMELIEQSTAQKKAERSWAVRIKLWLGWVTAGGPQRREEGRQELLAIRDPDAVAPLVLQMAAHGTGEVRLLLVQILKQIPGPAPVAPLVERQLYDPIESVRQSAQSAILESRSKAAVPLLIAALRKDSNPVVCRAAELLGRIGDRRAIGPLIDALITRHSYRVQVPDEQGISVSGGSGISPSGVSRIFSGLVPPEIEILSRTGQLPYGFQLAPSPLSASTPMKTVTIPVEVKNPPVLAALESLTGKNFGFHQRDWALWWALENG